jgi:hypothetical protein
MTLMESPVVEVLLAVCLASLALIAWSLARAAALAEDDGDDREQCPQCCESEQRRRWEQRGHRSVSSSSIGALTVAGARNEDGQRRTTNEPKLRHKTAADVHKRRTVLQPARDLPTTTIKNSEPLSQRKSHHRATACFPPAGVSARTTRAAAPSGPESLQRKLRKAESFRSMVPSPPSLPKKSTLRKTKSGGSARDLGVPPRWPAMESPRQSKMKLSSGTLFYCNVVKQELKRRALEEAMEDSIDTANLLA